MAGKKKFCTLTFALSVSAFLWTAAAQDLAQPHARRYFTLPDDIGLTQVNRGVSFSRSGQYFIVLSERGRLDIDRPESCLRVYRTREVEQFLSDDSLQREASPLWMITKSTYKNGPVISNARWLMDETGLTFLAKTADGNNRLFLADIRTRRVEPLTPENQDVTGFDVRNRNHYVYTVISAEVRQGTVWDGRGASLVGTGRSLSSLLFPQGKLSHNVWINDLSELWSYSNGKRSLTLERSTRRSIPIHLEGQRALALSPDGRSVVTALTVSDVPQEWETLYPPPFPTDPYRIRAGRQDARASNGQRAVSEYVVIDLVTGKTKSLTKAPTGNTTGWAGLTLAGWSYNGKSVVLSNTFLPPGRQAQSKEARRPCVAVAEVVTGDLTCVEQRKEQTESNDEEGGWVDGVRFVPGNSSKLVVHHASGGSSAYAKLGDGSWRIDPTDLNTTTRDIPIDISVAQSLNEPPALLATSKKTATSRVIWNPNPQLRDIRMGEVSKFNWKDRTGREWSGGLYMPPDYVRGRSYPLVIQTHGFNDQEFRPSGTFPTAFAAQELAAVGIVVLQVEDCPIRTSPNEASCQVAGYESAIDRLSADGLIDPDRVGIIGFSRTCFYVLASLTTGSLRFRAASITDGVDEGYLQYLTNVDESGNGLSKEADAIIGARPFGVGLQQWLKSSPGFNMDRVQTPLQVVALGPRSLLEMWEPYAALRYLNRPVDLIVVDSDEHVLTNPSAREVSQGSTIDWFRYWLQGYEDANPSKHGQYSRWKLMRTRREDAASQISSSVF